MSVSLQALKSAMDERGPEVDEGSEVQTLKDKMCTVSEACFEMSVWVISRRFKTCAIRARGLNHVICWTCCGEAEVSL